MFQLNSRTIDLYKAIIDRTVMLLIITVATVSLTGVFQLANAATPTTLFSMGTLGGTSSSGNAVSATGQVVGWSDITNDTYRHGFYWDSTNGIVDLAPSENISTANGINNNNTAVGWSQTLPASPRAVKWDVSNPSSPVMSDLTGLPANISSQANAINDNGSIVGTIKTGTQSSPIQTPFVWDSTNGFTALDTSGMNAAGVISSANAINTSGVIVGECGQHAVMWDATHNLIDLQTFGGTYAAANGINANGVVVGNVRGNSVTPGIFAWDTATNTSLDLSAAAIDIGTTGWATGINASNQIVGYFATTDPVCGPYHSFVIDPTDGFIDVGTDGTVTHGSAINDAGQVTGDSNPYYCSTAPAPSAMTTTKNDSKVYAATTVTTNNQNIRRASMWGAKIGQPKISVGSSSIVRSTTKNETISFPVSLSIPSRTAVTATYTIQQGGGNAIAGTDFIAETGTVTFKPNATTGLTPTTLFVTTTVKPSAAAGTKMFAIGLSNPNTATSGFVVGSNGIGIGNIYDNASGSGLRAYVTTTNVIEGDHGKNTARITVTLSAAATSTVSVLLSLQNGTALSGTDYTTFAPKTLTFSAGQFQKTVAVQTKTNMLSEANKTFKATLTNPTTGLTIVRNQSTITILNDD